MACPHWNGVCLKGHSLGSAQGCPIKKFEPIGGADYAPDQPVVQTPEMAGCCGGKQDMPPMTWPEVLKHFATSMAKWAKEGFPVVGSKEHGERYGLCKSCTKFLNFYCSICRCPAYTKTKLATEQCPLPEPRWRATATSQAASESSGR